MHVGIRLFYNSGWMGGVNYALNWTRALRFLPEGERPRLTLLTAAPAAQALAEGNAHVTDAIAPFSRAHALGLDFVYPATQLSEAPFGVPWAGWIPDWQCQHLPDLFSARERSRRLLQYRALAQHAPACILSSQMARTDTERLFPSGSAQLRVMPFPSVFDDEVYSRPSARTQAVRQRLGVPVNYVMICNQFWRHKNHLTVLEALRRVRRDDVCVVMTGLVEDERWPAYADAVRATLADPKVAAHAVLLGSIGREDQIDLLLGALGVVQPSRFEGWSTIVEETRALGLPSLLSDFPVHREQGPQGATFVGVDDVDAMAAALDAWFETPPARLGREQARAGQMTHVLACARSFMMVAREVAGAYDPSLHDPKAVAARALLDVRNDLDAGRNGLVSQDERLFQSSVRSLFPNDPIELARFTKIVCGDDYPLQGEMMSTLIAPVLAKMEAPARRAFLAQCESDGVPLSTLRAVGDRPASIVGRLHAKVRRKFGF